MRIVDENLNRLAEGLRVLEDAARMVLDDRGLTARLKALRHELVRGDLPFNLELLEARRASDDVGANLLTPAQTLPQPLALVTVANARRAQEALRVLEEMARLPEMAGKLDSTKFKASRFALYSIERDLVTALTRRDKARQINGLYVILDTDSLAGRQHLELAADLIQAGVKVLQIRDKVTPKDILLPLAARLVELCHQNAVLLIVNDHLDIALAAGADGLHVGQTDLPAGAARRLLPPDRLLGVSVATVKEARIAEAAGADYLGVGSVFPTSSKSDIQAVGLGRVREIRQSTRLPLAAIGGINVNNSGDTIRAGADAVCVISAVLNTPDAGKAARALIEVVHKARQSKGKIEADNEKINN